MTPAGKNIYNVVNRVVKLCYEIKQLWIMTKWIELDEGKAWWTAAVKIEGGDVYPIT